MELLILCKSAVYSINVFRGGMDGGEQEYIYQAARRADTTIEKGSGRSLFINQNLHRSGRIRVMNAMQK